MPQVKAVLGHVSVETAQRKRVCHRHRSGNAAHGIVRGETCLVVHGPDGADRNYCTTAAAEILTRAENDLAALRAGLGI